MAEVAAHEYEPTPQDQNDCMYCYHPSNHPVHALASRDYEVFVDGCECKHESFECSGPRPAVMHKCNDCSYAWTNSNKPGFVYCDICRNEQYPIAGKFITKDSGKREAFDSGMQRDTQDDKPRFDLLFPVGVPYSDQFLTRVAELLMRGAVKYEERNWEKAEGEAELNRFRSSANRHMIQWLCGETDEDHMAAIVFNLMGAHLVEWKLKNESR